MPIIKPPTYSKILNPKTGGNDPCYTFLMDFAENEQQLTMVLDDSSPITLETLQKMVLDNIAWWNTFISTFLQASAKHFSKPYTVEQINKITKHTLTGTPPTTNPVSVVFTPKNIQITGGVFLVHWEYHCEPILIDIPVVEEPIPDLKDPADELDGVEELNLNDLPLDKNATDETMELDSPARFYDKQKVKEARLKAKLAVYKAQHQMSKYYEKYGNEISDSDSETEEEFSEEEEEEEEEEVQL